MVVSILYNTDTEKWFSVLRLQELLGGVDIVAEGSFFTPLLSLHIFCSDGKFEMNDNSQTQVIEKVIGG